MNREELTFTVFISILLSFFICYSFYLTMNKNEIERIQSRNLFTDWRFWIPCLLYTFLLGYRYDYGFDWYQYQQTFIMYQHDVKFRDTTEIGYLFINKILGSLGGGFYSIFILEGFFWITALCLLTKDERKAWIFIIPIVYVSLRFRCLNLSRQFFGMSVLLVAYYFLRIGRSYMFWLLAVASGFIHSSCFVYIPIYFFVFKFKDRIKFPPLLFSFIVYIILFILMDVIQSRVFQYASFVSQIVQKDSDFYNTDDLLRGRFAWEERSLARRIFLLLKDFMFIYWIKVLDETNILFKKYRDFFILAYFSIYAYMVTGENEISTRFILFLSIFYLICWGLLVRNVFVLERNNNWFVYIFTIFIFFHYIYGIYPTLIEDFSKGMYLKYKFF